MTFRRSKVSTRWPRIAFLAIIAAGVAFTWWTAQEADRTLRLTSLLKARLVAQSISLERVKRLTGTPADIAADNYRVLKTRLERMRKADPSCRFVYLLGRRTTGQIFFYVDSEPVGSPNESPAGQIYAEAPAEDYRFFETRQEGVIGPVKDRWGTWVSPAVPLIDPETGEMVALLGMDMDAADWRRQVALRCAIPVGMAALLILGLGAALIAYRRAVERKLASLAIEERDSRLAALLQASPIATFVIDHKHQVTHWNSALESLSGILARDILGTRQQWRAFYANERPCMADLLVDQDFDEISRIYENKSRESELIKGAFEATDFFPAVHGGTWLRFTAAPIRDAAGHIIGAIETLENITDRIEAENALRDSENRFRSVLENLGQIAVHAHEADGTITFWNSTCETLYGFSKAEALGRDAVALLDPPDIREEKRLQLNDCLRSGVPPEPGETEIEGKDGRRRTIYVSRVLHQRAGRPPEFFCFAVDVTERRQAEEDLRRSQAILKSIFRSAPVGIGVVINRVIQWSNEHLCEMTGYTEDDLTGQSSRILYPTQEDFDYVGSEKYRQIKMSGTGLVETHWLCKDGRVIDVLLSSTPLDVNDLEAGVVFTALDITTRKANERALRESEERHRVIFEASQDALMTLAPPEWRFTAGNRRTVALFGLENESAFVKLAPWDLSPDFQPDGRRSTEKAAEMLEAALTKGSHLFEWTHKRLDGSLFPATVLLTRTELAGQVFLQCTVRDITAQKQTEDTIRMMAQMLDVAPNSITVHDFDGRFLYANQKTFDLHGYSQEDFDRLTLHDVDVPESAAHIEDRMRLIRDRGEALFEVAHFRKDGTTFPMEVFVKLVDWRGQPALLSVATDISARKKAEESLREKTEELERYFSTALDLFCIADTDGYFRRLNQQWERTLGYTLADLEGKKFFDFIHPDDLQPTAERVQELDDQREVSDFTNRYRCKDGSYRWIEWRSYPSGKTIFAAARDITDRKRAEVEKERLEAELQQAQKMEAVGRLAGGVAHDFNNMLSVILGHAELGLSTLEADDPLCQDLDEIRKAAERSADLTRQLLAFARKQTIAPRVLNLNEAVESMLKMLSRLIGEDIELVWLPAPDLSLVKMDPVQLNQILANLAVNARDAISGTGRLSIETANVVFDEEYCQAHVDYAPGSYVMLAVSDNGCGMSRETLNRLFEPFFTTKGIGKGTGLGLATIYGIVRQNNGFLNVYSELGHGTTFKIYIPEHGVVESGAAKKTSPAAIPTGNETILLVEDEPLLLKLLTTMMEKLGYAVLATNKPNQAIQLATEHGNSIQLLVTDLVMPEMNGRELAERIQTISPGLKCLFISGYTANVIAHHGVVDAGIHFLQKPCTREMLAAKLREVLE